MKKWKIILLFLILLGAFFVLYPQIEFQTEDQFIACRYTDDISEFEDEISLDERYIYYADRNISITDFDMKKFLCFYVLLMDYEEGNLIESQYILEETYMQDFLKNAVITENTDNVDLGKLINGKEAVVSNTRYVAQDDAPCSEIYYTLHDEYQVMFVYNVDDLLVIQIGYPDEGPKYIAYRTESR